MADDMELPIHSEGPEEEIEIELTDEDLGDDAEGADAGPDEAADDAGNGEAAEAQEEAPQAEEIKEEEPRKKREGRKDHRISELSRRAQEAELRAQELETRLQREAELRQQSDLAMMTHYEGVLSAQANEAKRKLIEARNLGDTDAEVEAQSALIQAQNDLSAVQAWRANNPSPAPVRARPEVTPQPDRSQPQVSLDPTTAEWIKKNEWFAPNSPNFDAEMHEEATLYARRVERRYKAEGRADEIGTQAYFREIDRHIRTEFPDAFEGETPPKKAAPPMARGGGVAPVTRQGAPTQGDRSGRTVKLTADQRRFAHQMAASGAYKNQNGSRMTNEQAEKHYAIYMMKQNRR